MQPNPSQFGNIYLVARRNDQIQKLIRERVRREFVKDVKHVHMAHQPITRRAPADVDRQMRGRLQAA